MKLKDNAHLVAYYTGVLLVGLGTVLPDLRLWAFNNWTYYQGYIQIAVFAVALAAPIVLRRIFAASEISGKARLPFAAVGVIYTGIITTAFVVFHARLHFLGDGIVRLNLLARIDPALRKSDFGAYIIAKELYKLVESHVSDPADWTYHVLSYFGGAAFVAITLIFAARFFGRFYQRLLFTLIVTTAGSSLLFFGYVENYSIFAAMVLLTVLVCVEVTAGRLSRYYIIPALVITVALHFLGAALIPGAVHAFLYKSGLHERFNSAKRSVRYSLLGLLGLAMVVAFLNLYDLEYYLQFQFIPLIENRFTIANYTLFSMTHLADYANLLFMLFPGIIIAAAGILISKGSGLFTQPEFKSLLVTTAFCACAAFAFYPQLGMPRDWDLYPFFGIPLSVFGAYVIVVSGRKSDAGIVSASMAVILNLMVLSPRVGAQIDGGIAMAQMKYYGRLDPSKYMYIHKHLVDLSWRRNDAVALEELELMSKTLSPEKPFLDSGLRLKQQNEFDSAIAQFKKALTFNPMLTPAYYNAGSCYFATGRFDSARSYFEIADGWNPNNPEIINELGYACAGLGDYESAENYWKKLLLVAEGEVTGQLNLLDLYSFTGQRTKKTSFLEDVKLSPNLPGRVLKQFGDHYYSVGLMQDALITYRQSISRGLDSLSEQDVYAKFPALRQ